MKKQPHGCRTKADREMRIEIDDRIVPISNLASATLRLLHPGLHVCCFMPRKEGERWVVPFNLARKGESLYDGEFVLHRDDLQRLLKAENADSYVMDRWALCIVRVALDVYAAELSDASRRARDAVDECHKLTRLM